VNRWTWHGGGLAAARAHFGEGDWLDLSTGINPHSWPGAAELAIDWRRLPDEADLRVLEDAAARHFGADPHNVCALPGTEVGLRLIGDLLAGPVRYRVPSYRTHAEMVPNALGLASDRWAQADGATLILANPNNPDGRCFPREELLDLLMRRGRKGWLVVDEAFADATPTHSLAPDVGDDKRLLVFRSFGKFFGLAGLRLGFVLGPAALLVRLRRRLGAWPVSAAGLTIGTAAYRDADWIAAMRARLRREATALDAVLARLGYAVIGHCPLFRLVLADDATMLFERLARQAILTRPFAEEPRWLRLGLPGSEEALSRLEAALRDG
jgi:cobalamin biosynthetic protein CobC